MSARNRDFLYQRSHPGLVARLNAVAPAPQAAASASASTAQTAGPITSNTATPTSVPPATTTQSSSTDNPFFSLQISVASSSPSQSSSSSSSPSRSSSTSVSSAVSSHTTSSAISTSSTQGPSTNSFVTPGLTTQVVGASLTPSATLAPATTSSAGPGSSGSTNTAAIVGGIAGTLVGIAIFGFLLMWCMRRQRDRDIDDFDAQAFKRQSAMLIDEPVEPSRSYNPRPPTMIERHNATPALAAQPGYGGQNFYGNYGGYGQQPPYGPPEPVQPARSPPPQAFGAPPMAFAAYNDPHQRIPSPPHAVHAPYHAQQHLARQASNAAYLTRQPSAAAGYPPPVASAGLSDPNYIDLNRSSVSPYQAAQYADISRQLGATDPNSQLTRQSLALPEGPLPSPFDDPVQATPGHATEAAASAAPVTAAASAPQTRGHAAEPYQRPDTVYEEGDVYGAI